MPRPRKFNKHRQLIFRKVVLDNRPLPLAELRELLNGEKYTNEMARCDVAALRAVGCLVELRPCPGRHGEKQIVFLDGPHTDDDAIRETINPDGKRLAARPAAAVICGLAYCEDKKLLPRWMEQADAQKALDRMFEDTTAKGGRTFDEEMAARVRSVLLQIDSKLNAQRGEQAIDSADDVLKLVELSNFALEAGKRALRTKLHAFWAEPFRLVAIDSGTTNLILARQLRELRLPVLGTPLCSLTVCTNSRKIFEVLGPPEVSTKCIIIGGQQKFHSAVIAGAMAELFLRTASVLQFGICVLGATKVDVDRFVACSDSQEEAAMKNLFMEKSSLRVICVDHGKLQTGPGREGYKFAAIDPSHIDLIITNSPFGSEGAPEDGPLSFRAKVAAIEARGVPVLVATGPGTLDHPHQ